MRKFLLVITLLVSSITANAQNRFNVGLTSPVYFGAGRFEDVLKYRNEIANYDGSDATSFRPAFGFGFFASLEFQDKWTFDLNWQKTVNTTNFGKGSINPNQNEQYKMSIGLIGLGASRKVFKYKNHDFWAFGTLSGGKRSFEYRPEGGEFTNQRTINGRLFVASDEAPLFLTLGIAPKFFFKDKFYFSPRLGYDMEIMRGDGGDFYGGLVEIIQPGFGIPNPQPKTITYVELDERSLNRLFIEFRLGILLKSNSKK
jgi:hypothetical protein